jgi:hypothetical protein
MTNKPTQLEINNLTRYFGLGDGPTYQRHAVQAAILAAGYNKYVSDYACEELQSAGVLSDHDESEIEMPLHARSLLARKGITIPAAGIPLAELDAKLSASNTTIEDRFFIKGVLKAAAKLKA